MGRKKKPTGRCCVCGAEADLTAEHFIPRAAGGDKRAILYDAEELVKTLSDKSYKPYGKICQQGTARYTLCKKCNEYSGLYYDTAFSRFINTLNKMVSDEIGELHKASPNKSYQEIEELLHGHSAHFALYEIEPFNIAKRVLVSFCSVERPGLTDAIPEVRKAILDKSYKPNTDKFSLSMCLHIGDGSYYASLATICKGGEPHMYAGIEHEHIAFYLMREGASGKVAKGPYEPEGETHYLDITNWLIDFDLNQKVDMTFMLPFNKSQSLCIPIPKLP